MKRASGTGFLSPLGEETAEALLRNGCRRLAPEVMADTSQVVCLLGDSGARRVLRDRPHSAASSANAQYQSDGYESK